MFNFRARAAKPTSTPMEAVLAQQAADAAGTEAALKDAVSVKKQAVLLRNAAVDAKRLRVELLKAQKVQAEACAELVLAEQEVFDLLNGGLDALTLQQPEQPMPTPPPLPVIQPLAVEDYFPPKLN
jgi:hypothetical protein